MNNRKIITVIIDDKIILTSPTAFCVYLDIDCIELSSLKALLGIVLDDNFHTDLIIFDIEKLCSYTDVGVLDVIMMLKTLINCACVTKLSKIKTIPIAVSVNLNTSLPLIREVMSTGYITGVYPGGIAFNTDEQILAMLSLINNEHHMPLRMHALLNKKRTVKAIKTKSTEIILTSRQQQILSLIVKKGASNKLIARILNISESTVKLHMSHILKKHGLTNRTQLALFSKNKNGTIA